MSSPNPVPASESPGPSTKVTTVLVVLSKHEGKLFFETDFSDKFAHPDCDIQMVDSETLCLEDWPAFLKQVQPDVIVTAWSTPPFPKDLPLEEIGLKYVCHLVGSVRSKIPIDLIERGLIVTNWGGSISRTIAECALMFTLMGLRRTAHWHEVIHHQRGWNTPRGIKGQLSLFGRRVGIHGFGRIARELVTLMQPFKTTISTYAPLDSDEVLAEFGVKRCENIDQLFAENDIVVELAALNDATYHSVGQAQLELLPDNAVFVNVGRGAVVDEAALIREAAKGRIRIAMDVFETEPPPEDSPLRDLSNVVMMPHQGGPTYDQGVCSGKFAIENLERYLSGEPLEAQITADIFELMT